MCQARAKYDPLAWQGDCDTETRRRAYQEFGWTGYRLRNRQAIQQVIGNGQKWTVLDAGCFVGMYAGAVLGCQQEYTGLDVTPKFIQAARKTYPECEFVLGDIRNLHFRDRRFDFVFNFGVLIHLDSAEQVIAELWRVANRTLLIEATTNNGDADISLDDDGRFIHTAYSSERLGMTIGRITGGAVTVSAVPTYGGFQSTLWRVDRPT